MVVADDIDKLDDWVCSQGWQVRTDASGYRRFYTPDGTYVTRYPATPSNPRRRYKEVLVALRRGFGVASTVKETTAVAAQEGWSAMNEWTVLVTLFTQHALDEDTLDALADVADKRDASVSNRADGPGYTVTLQVKARDPLAAAKDAVRFACDEIGADLPGTVVDLRVTTPEQYEAEASRPDFPPLASAADAAEILGVSRQRVHQLAASNTRFPAPIVRVGSGPLWTVPAIEHFDRIWDRKPGRPQRKQDDSGSENEPRQVPSQKTDDQWFNSSASRTGDHPQRRRA
ncbi:MAG: hypothetical protein ACRDTE_20625 [Pseudonocardiaceae bacterium]